MFHIEMRVTKNGTCGAWFRIWGSEDGADCACYLRECVSSERKERDPGHTREYRMVYINAGDDR